MIRFDILYSLALAIGAAASGAQAQRAADHQATGAQDILNQRGRR
jgi:hypothetical protein